MVHPLRPAALLELPVDLLGPHLADGLHLDPRRRQAEGKALGVGQLDFAFLGQRAGGYLPRRRQQVGVPVPLVAFPIGGVQRHVDRAAVLLRQAAGEPHRQFPPLRLAQLVRQGHFPLPGGAGSLRFSAFSAAFHSSARLHSPAPSGRTSSVWRTPLRRV